MSFAKAIIMSNGARSMHLHKNDLFGLILRITVACAVSYYGFKYLVNMLDPTRKQKLEAQRKAREIMDRLGISHDLFKLSEYEMIIATHLVEPLSMSVTWKDIAGLDDIIQEMQETIILPIKSQTLFQTSKLIQPPKGVLLHGPPGCGKTLLAKATAKEAGTRFINLQVSSLTDKWYGESQKLAAAVFSLAVKLQPTIIFIDEIDSFLRSRDTHDHEATAMMKAQFMSLWDGLCTDHNCIVIVMGATNRPQDIDKAILRRMPATFHIGLPSLAQRKHIMQLILDSEPVAVDVNIDVLASKTENFSGSDLRELCRNAAVYRVKDYLTTSVDEASKTNCDCKYSVEALRSIKMDDFLNALSKIKESKVCTN